jgi:hypothetical protein
MCWFLAIIHLELDKSGHEEEAAKSVQLVQYIGKNRPIVHGIG